MARCCGSVHNCEHSSEEYCGLRRRRSIVRIAAAWASSGRVGFNDNHGCHYSGEAAGSLAPLTCDWRRLGQLPGLWFSVRNCGYSGLERLRYLGAVGPFRLAGPGPVPFWEALQL
jgi:hypothetical protein